MKQQIKIKDQVFSKILTKDKRIINITNKNNEYILLSILNYHHIYYYYNLLFL
jgi:hypothetical protein